MRSTTRIGIIQHNPVIGDINGNVERINDAYTALLDADPDLIVTPELSLVGYPARDLLHREGILDAQEAAIDELARLTVEGPPIVVGATLRTDRETGPPIHNSGVVLSDGERTDTYHKRLLPTYDVFDEHRYFLPGTKPLVVDVNDVTVGITICEDAWHNAVVTGSQRHDVAPLHETAAQGADLILTLSASPFSLDKPARREKRFLTHATETDCPVVFVNQVGGNDELIFDGHSLVASGGGLGERLAGFERDTAVVDVPLNGDPHAPVSTYQTDIATQARRALRLGVRDYFAKTGFEEAIIGLSGGIDSSATAALAADALGSDNVYGVSLPSQVTSQQSITDAQSVAENLGIEFDVIPIESIVESIDRTIDEHGDSLTGVAAENIQARIRGDVLMGVANQRDALVLTPDNKSEGAVGYCTLYGDTVGGLAPLGDCYKRIVYELAASFNNTPPQSARSTEAIPKSVIDKPPSAELRSGQTDTDELPSYDKLDSVLEGYIENARSVASLRETHPTQAVDTAVTMTTRAEFKRRQTPPPLRITQKSLGRGWKYPIAASYKHVHDTK